MADEQIEVMNPQGQRGTIPAAQVSDAIKAGYRLTKHAVMYDKEGNRGLVPNEQVAGAVKAGYQASPPTPQFESENPPQSTNDQQAREFLLGAASGASGLPETQTPIRDALTPQRQSTADVAGSSLLGPAYSIGKSLYGVGKEILSPQQKSESPEDATLRRYHGAGTLAGAVVPMALGDAAKTPVKAPIANALRLEEGTGALKPGVRVAAGGVGTAIGGGIGYATHVPGAGYVGAVSGGGIGAGLADFLTPKLPPKPVFPGAAFPDPMEFYANRAAEVNAANKLDTVMKARQARINAAPTYTPPAHEEIPLGHPDYPGPYMDIPDRMRMGRTSDAARSRTDASGAMNPPLRPLVGSPEDWQTYDAQKAILQPEASDAGLFAAARGAVNKKLNYQQRIGNKLK